MTEDIQLKFMMAVLALGLIATLQGEEKPKSAAANRCQSAHDSIIRVCDLYIPAGIDSAKINNIWNVLDDPVMQVLKDNSDKMLLGVTA